MKANAGAPKSADSADVALGKAIRLRRRQVGMSQGALAEASGVSFQQIQKYENGANRVSFSRLVLIAKALECGVVDLVAVVDAASGGGEAGDLLALMSAPGAADLLVAYSALSAEEKGAVVALLETFAESRRRARRE